MPTGTAFGFATMALGGSEGVGWATTRAVVNSSLAVTRRLDWGNFSTTVARRQSLAFAKVEIEYQHTIRYDGNRFSLRFPMVVGPRYNPASVNDARAVSPPVARPETRAGHDISVAVTR